MKIAALATAMLTAFAATAPALADTITCESTDGRERYCSANTRGGVVLSTQLSRNGCYQGETWGYDRHGIWVNSGCRAVFNTGGYDGYNYHSSNNYYGNDYNNNNYNNNHHSSNDGAAAAVAIGAVFGAAIIASAASNNKAKNTGQSSAYPDHYNAGCTAGANDKRDGRKRNYTRYDDQYTNSTEQAFASGYNKCY